MAFEKRTIPADADPADVATDNRSLFEIVEARVQHQSTTIIILAGVIAALIGGGWAYHTATNADKQSKAACGLYHDVALSPLAPQTTALGLSIAKNVRIAYAGAHCKLGPLPAPDERIRLLLPPALRNGGGG